VELYKPFVDARRIWLIAGTIDAPIWLVPPNFCVKLTNVAGITNLGGNVYLSAHCTFLDESMGTHRAVASSATTWAGQNFELWVPEGWVIGYRISCTHDATKWADVCLSGVIYRIPENP
jgi:hypothetical protein